MNALHTRTPVETLLKRFQIYACILGVFSSNGSPLTEAFVLSDHANEELFSVPDAYDALAGAPVGAFASFSKTLPAGGDTEIRIAVLRDAALSALTSEEQDELAVAIRHEFEGALLEKSAGNARRSALARRRLPNAAVYVLDERGTIVSAWPAHGSAKSSIEKPDGSLRPHAAMPLFRRLATWNWGDAAACEAFMLSPVPGIALQVYPIQRSGERVECAVLVQEFEVRHTVERFRSTYNLSARESEVLVQLLQGSSMAQVAQALSIAESTVHYHVKNAMAKAGARNRMHLAARVLGWDS